MGRQGESGIGKRAAALALSPDGQWLYVVAGQENKLAIVSTASQQKVAEIFTGADAYGLALSPDGKIAYVTNRGTRI